MFFGQLTREQVDKFVQEHLIEADFHPELPSKKRQIDLFAFYRDQDAIGVHYCSKLFNTHITLYLMDQRMEPLISKELEDSWIKYLYSIFGEEYKNWYLSEKARLFD